MLLSRVLWILTIRFASCANILGIFPIPYVSHQVMTRVLMRDLADRGHHLTIFTTHPFDYDNRNVTQHHFNETEAIYNDIVNQLEYKKSSSKLTFALNELRLMKTSTEQQLNQREMQNLITNGKKNEFDLVIVECYLDCPFMAFGEIFDAPIIAISALEISFVMLRLMGNDVNPVVYPERAYLPYVQGKLSFAERLDSLLVYCGFQFFYQPIVDHMNKEFMRKHFPKVTASPAQLNERVAMVFTNSLMTARPLLPNTIQLSFMHINPSKPLPDGEVKAFLDASTKGVILMSLGSYAKSKDLDERVIDTFVSVFGSLPFDVLWKFEGELRSKSENVLTSSWLPQADILAHPSLRLFITHGGLNSIQEAIDREVPMLIIPLTYDQPGNAAEMVDKGVACTLDLNTLSEGSLRDAISELMKPRYMQNIRRLRRHLQDRPMSSRETAVWHAEHVIRHKGAEHLKCAARNVPLYQSHYYDIILLVSIVAYLTVVSARSLWSRFSPNRRGAMLAKKIA